MSAPRKPRDLGNGLVCASFGRAGEWLSFATVDPEAGFVEVTGLPVFDPELRGNVEAVLRYRSWMRREEHAFLRVEAGRASITSREDAPRGSRAIVQRLVLRAPRRERPTSIRIRVSGRLARPALAEVREVPAAAGPLGGLQPGQTSGAAAPKSRVKAREGTLRMSGEGSPVVIQAWLRQAATMTAESGGRAPGSRAAGAGATAAAEDRSDRRLSWSVLRRRIPTAVAEIAWPSGAEEVRIDIACAFDAPVDPAPEWLVAAPVRPAGGQPSGGVSRPGGQPSGSVSRPGGQASGGHPQPGARPLRVPDRLVRAVSQLDQRAASYARTCTALRVAPGERCLLADHRILPLSWTRDAYWQARLLLASWQRGSHDDDVRIVADHLRWLFLRCERPDGRWVRSHHADGRRKDAPFRADQQLYPLLELADYVTATASLPELPPGSTWPDLVATAWEAAERAIDAQSGLLATEEDAADELPSLPCLASDQVLLWHTSSRLAAEAHSIGLDAAPFLERATGTRSAFAAHLVVEGSAGRRWAGSSDGRGATLRHVEATDLPVALAPLWGFCAADDAAWRRTIDAAFERANPGFVPGAAGGLGSRHMPGTWTLGDVFAWAAFGQMGEALAAEAVLERLVAVAFSDGMLPEAYDPDGSGAVVRHWYALPGAVLGTLVLEHATRGGAG